MHTGEELHERPALTRLREAARRHEFAALYVHSTDRLSRDPIHLGIVLEEMERAGAAVMFVTEPLDDSEEGQLIRYVHGYGNKMENAKRASARCALSGHVPSAASSFPAPGPPMATPSGLSATETAGSRRSA